MNTDSCLMNERYLGIDMGTSALKLILTDGTGKVLAEASEHYTAASLPDGGSEIDPGRWYQALAIGVTRIMEGQDRHAVRAIGLTGQMHTLTVLGVDGNVLRPSILWNDLRTRDLIPALKPVLRDCAEGAYLSDILSTGSPAAALYWLRQYEPEVFDRIGHFLIGSDYLGWRLTGQYTTDYCYASTSCLYEPEHRRWSPQIRELLGLPENVYPAVCGSAQIAGTLTAKAARDLNLPEETSVLVGTGDNAATAFACHVETGNIQLSLGTSGVLVAAPAPGQKIRKGKRFLFSRDGRTCTNYVQGVVQSCGSTLSWWMKKILGENDFTWIDRHIDPEEQGGSTLLFYPHLSGEKTLYADPSLRGAFLGLSQTTRREDMIYTVMEGICFAFRELYEEMGLSGHPVRGPLITTGGGTLSRVWMQTLANVLNQPVRRDGCRGGAAFGAAMLAVQACGHICAPAENNSITSATCSARPDDHSPAPAANDCEEEPLLFLPSESAVSACTRRYEMYRRIHRGMDYIVHGSQTGLL